MKHLKTFNESITNYSKDDTDSISIKDIYNNNTIISITKKPVDSRTAMRYVQCLIEHKLKNEEDSSKVNDLIDYLKQFYK